MHDTPRARLLDARMGALFTHDDAGRIDRINEPNGGPAPRFFFAQTTAGKVWRFRHDVPEALVRELTALCLAEAATAEVEQRPHGAERMVELLDQDAAVEKVWTGPAFLFPTGLDRPSRTVPITAETASFLTPGFQEWVPDVEASQPFMAAVVEDRAVSVCCSVRVSPLLHEAGVETLPPVRRAGHGTRAVAAWAAAVQALGAVPMYSTSWENMPSLGLARNLGLAQFGLDFHVT